MILCGFVVRAFPDWDLDYAQENAPFTWIQPGKAGRGRYAYCHEDWRMIGYDLDDSIADYPNLKQSQVADHFARKCMQWLVSIERHSLPV